MLVPNTLLNIQNATFPSYQIVPGLKCQYNNPKSPSFIDKEILKKDNEKFIVDEFNFIHNFLMIITQTKGHLNLNLNLPRHAIMYDVI